ncbi:MAG: DUF4236 domain-containing protein [Terrisporobacter sp.]|uniref:DUF4236 domain-containing protein n=1 Tax=Terrisporobacter sp. TaxID=1965305 RepID=UPI002FC9882B
MGLRFRKSIKICKGVSVNFGKKSTSLSFGTNGLRYTVSSTGKRTASAGIPGTGLYYSTLTKSKNNKDYNAKQINGSNISNNIQENELIIDRYNEHLNYIRGVHKSCDDYLDWHKLKKSKPPFTRGDIGPREKKAIKDFEDYNPTFGFLFKSKASKEKEKLQQEIEKAKQEDLNEYKEWVNIVQLSNNVLEGDIDSYFYVIKEMKPFDDLLELGSGFECSADNANIMEVKFEIKSKEVIPDFILSLTKTGKISQKNMTKTMYYDIMQDYVCSCSIRVARDMMALLPVEKVIVDAVDNILDTSTGMEKEITVLSVVFDRNTLDSLNLDFIDPSDSLKNFDYNMDFLKTKGFREIDNIGYEL